MPCRAKRPPKTPQQVTIFSESPVSATEVDRGYVLISGSSVEQAWPLAAQNASVTVLRRFLLEPCNAILGQQVLLVYFSYTAFSHPPFTH